MDKFLPKDSTVNNPIFVSSCVELRIIKPTPSPVTSPIQTSFSNQIGVTTNHLTPDPLQTVRRKKTGYHIPEYVSIYDKTGGYHITPYKSVYEEEDE